MYSLHKLSAGWIYFSNLTLYAPCIILQYAYKPTRCAKFSSLNFIFHLMLYMFRTILVHLQEQILWAVHRIWYMSVYAGICRYVWLLCGYKSCSWRWTNIVWNMYSIKWKIKFNDENFAHLVGSYAYYILVIGLNPNFCL